MSVPEVAELLANDYGVVDALNLDGGGSTTLAIADPTPRVVNVPVGVKDVPDTERPVGSNLAVFARRREPNRRPVTVWRRRKFGRIAHVQVTLLLRGGMDPGRFNGTVHAPPSGRCTCQTRALHYNAPRFLSHFSFADSLTC